MTLQLRAINKRFGERQVLHQLDLDVANGECVALLGASGCGKSTALRLIAGDKTQGRAFPTAAGSKQSDAFAVGHIEVELVENLSLAEALVDGPKLQCHPLMAPLVSPLTIWR